ncbi:MAG TPA: response regulator transcription factor [Chloroflexi bacterium]|nr:response regulator transcription factor [Chloroflexota bacterium]
MTDPSPTTRHPGARILVVDDEDSTRHLLVRALSLMGFTAHGAASGRVALEMLQQTPFDLVLLDLRMPDLDGVAVLQFIQEQDLDVEVVLLTAHATLESAIAAVRAGAHDYLLKPCPFPQIVSSIEKALDQRRAQQHLRRAAHLLHEALAVLEAPEDRETVPSAPSPARFLQVGSLVLDREKKLVIRGDETIALSPLETEILALLMAHPGQVFPPRAIVRAIHGFDVSEAEARDLVRAPIYRLRRKLEPDPTSPRYIQTVRGSGYLFAYPAPPTKPTRS